MKNKPAYKSAQSALRALADPAKAEILLRFFKTGKGEYGAGDRFLGVTVPQIRTRVPRFADMGEGDIESLLKSPFNEIRLFALLVMVKRFQKGNAAEKGRMYRLYLKNLKAVNNWNLVDASAPYIVGGYLASKNFPIPATLLRQGATQGESTKSGEAAQQRRRKAGIHAPVDPGLRRGGKKKILYTLSKSKDMWARRVAIVSTLGLIRAGIYDDTLNISSILLKDKEDLIHKACGWMLREVGKRDEAVLENFLKKHAAAMPRTMLRYAIEKFPEGKRKAYLRK